MVERFILVGMLAIPLAIAWIGLPQVTNLSLPTNGSEVSALFAPPPVTSESRAESAVVVPPAWATPRPRYAAPDAAPPPTLAPYAPPTAVSAAVGQPTVAPSPTPEPSRERVVITNTGGIGAAVRSQPGGQRVTGLRDGAIVEVLERTTHQNREWVRIRTPEGAEGWIFGLASAVVEPGRAQPATFQAPATAQANVAARASTPVPATAPRAPAAPQAQRPAGATRAPVVAPAQPVVAPTRTTPPANESVPPAGGSTHTVQRGDQLRHIAARYGVSMSRILAVNHIPNPDSLTVGQVLTIPEP